METTEKKPFPWKWVLLFLAVATGFYLGFRACLAYVKRKLSGPDGMLFFVQLLGPAAEKILDDEKDAESAKGNG